MKMNEKTKILNSDLKVTVKELKKILENLEDDTLVEFSGTDVEYYRREAENILFDIGLSADNKGYHAIVEAICLISRNETYCYQFTKKVYPYIANKFGSTYHGVQSAISIAINKVCEHGNKDKLKKYLGGIYNPHRGYPRLAEFVCTLYQYIKCRKEKENAKKS
jgi:hypothetical protein